MRRMLHSRRSQLLVDGVIFATSFAAAYLIRFERLLRWQEVHQFLIWLPYLVIGRLLVNRMFGIYRFIWRYVSLHEAVAIARASSVATLFLMSVRFLYPSKLAFSGYLHVPLGIIALEYLLSLIGMVSVRALHRGSCEKLERSAVESVTRRKRILLFGAGSAGVLLARDLKHRADVEIVGFIDDDPQKADRVLDGLAVLGSGDQLEKIVNQSGVEQLVISIASPPGDFLSRVVRKSRRLGVSVKIIPTMWEIFGRQSTLSHVHDIRVEDILGRDRVDVIKHETLLRETYAGKRILVTGGAGSIGSEAVRQLAQLNPFRIAIFDKDENSVYELQQELLIQNPDCQLALYIGDTKYKQRVGAIFNGFRPDIVFHAAAHKHVPLMESNPCEAVLNNVVGTQNVLEACHEVGVERFIYISSDKAVKPTSVMGATKRIGEVMVQAFSRKESLPAACVRFGNVLGSRGSVIPLFQKQIAQGGPLTVTHPDIVRFFMMIPEAVQLVMCAGALGTHAEIFVLDMGQPRRILDVAHEMLAMAGLQPGRDIEVQIVGLRPGEKLYEELTDATETLCPTSVARLMRIVQGPGIGQLELDHLENLLRAAHENDSLGVHESLASLNIGYHNNVDSGVSVRLAH